MSDDSSAVLAAVTARLLAASSATNVASLAVPCTTHRTSYMCMHLKFEPKIETEFTMKKRSERRKHCALAVVRRSQKFSPPADPLPRGAEGPKFYQLETVAAFTNKPSLVRIDASNYELSW